MPDPEEVERPLRRRVDDDAEEDRGVEHPGRGLADGVDLDLEAAWCEQERAGEQEDVPPDDDREPHPGQPVVDGEEDHGGVDHQPVGERVGELPEVRLDVPAAREEAVHLVGDRGDAEDDARRPARVVPGLHHEHDEDGDQRQPRDGERVRELRERLRDGAEPPCGKDTGVLGCLACQSRSPAS